MSDLAGIYQYRRIGRGERDLDLCPDGTIGIGAGRAERNWLFHFVNRQYQLSIRGDFGEICRLKLDSDGCWRGRWNHYERMPVELRPLDIPGMQAFENRGGGGAAMLNDLAGLYASTSGASAKPERPGHTSASNITAASNIGRGDLVSSTIRNGSKDGQSLRVLWIMSDFAQGGITRYTKDLFDVLNDCAGLCVLPSGASAEPEGHGHTSENTCARCHSSDCSSIKTKTLAAQGRRQCHPTHRIEFHILYVKEFFTDSATKARLNVPCERYSRRRFLELLAMADLVTTPGINLFTDDHEYILRQAGPKLFAQVHGTCQYSRNLIALHLPYTKRFVCCSRAVTRILPDDCETICPPFPIDLGRITRRRSKADARREFGIPSGRRVVTVACRMAHDKNLVETAKAVASLPEDVMLLCVGDGYAADEIHPQMREILGDRLIFKPWMAVPADYLDASDCFICLSDHEGGPLTVLEALIHGTPVVSTPVGVVRELFLQRPGRTDMSAVFHYSSPSDILRAMEFTDADELRQISEFVKSRSDPEKIRQVWTEWLYSLVPQ